MFDMSAILASGLAFFVVAASPGPANISNATIAMSHGRKASLIYGTGLVCGVMFWGLIAVSGLGAVLQSSVYVLMVLKVLGGVYLLWLAYLSGKAAYHGETSAYRLSGQNKWFVRGLLLNISNPKTVIAWLAALTVGMQPGDGMMVLLTNFAVCTLAGAIAIVLHSLAFSMRRVMSAYQRFSRWISGVVAGLFALAGLGLIRSAFSRS